MNKDGSDTLYIDSQYFDDCSFIEYNSPDVTMDLLTLTSIIYKRRWIGELKDWTDMPIQWGMDKFKVGYNRYSDALERLVKWGIVQKMEGKQGKYRKQEMYKYVIRDDSKHWETEIAQWGRNRSKYKPKQNNVKGNSTVVEKQILQHAPLGGKVLRWTGNTMEYESCTIEEMNATPVCPFCGKHFFATEAFQIQTGPTKSEHEEWKTPAGETMCMLCGLDLTAKEEYRVKPSIGGKFPGYDEIEKLRLKAHKLFKDVE